jgi:hypothetical protein
VVKGGEVASPASSAFSINALAASFCAAKPMAKEKVVVWWSKPPLNSYKLNIDASFHSDGTGAAGVVLRNHEGEAITGMACTLENL